ncbi:MAG: DUF2911 domain-containing protein [Pseudonocardia sp.]|nr:DUF2911 domain-containing protein [Pseudonocardia sp.]
MAMLAVSAASARAQTTTDLGTGGGGSQHVKTEWTVGAAHISISYGRPALKGRPESQMMPAGQPWRTGADAATVLTTDKPLTFGKVVLQPGSYTINTQPGEKSWELIFGKLQKEGQWGVPYLPALEIARTPMTVQTLVPPVEQVTINIERVGPTNTLRVSWGSVGASANFKVGS